jgi:hypothetical protein
MDTLSDVTEKIERVRRRLARIDTALLNNVNLLVFVLLTTAVAVVDIADLSRIVWLFTGERGYTGGSAFNDRGPLYSGVFQEEFRSFTQLPFVANISFLIVIGEILFLSNRRLLDQSRVGAVVALGVYVVLLSIASTRYYPIIWILSAQVCLLILQGGLFSLVVLSQLWAAPLGSRVTSDD